MLIPICGHCQKEIKKNKRSKNKWADWDFCCLCVKQRHKQCTTDPYCPRINKWTSRKIIIGGVVCILRSRALSSKETV